MHRIRILCLKAANGHGAASGILSGILIKQSLSKTLGPYSTAVYGLRLPLRVLHRAVPLQLMLRLWQQVSKVKKKGCNTLLGLLIRLGSRETRLDYSNAGLDTKLASNSIQWGI